MKITLCVEENKKESKVTVEVTLNQYTKFHILTSENREKIKKSHLLRETKKKKLKWMENYVQESKPHPLPLKFSAPSFRESPSLPPFNREIFQTPPF